MAVVGRVVEDSVPLGGLNNGDFGSDPNLIVDVGGITYFSADDGINGRELWRVGPTGPAEMVENSIPGGGIAPGILNSSPSYLTNFNGTLYFAADDGTNGIELWRVNGAGLAELVSGSGAGGFNSGANSSSPSDFKVVGPSLYFVADDGVSGRELWRLNAAGNTQLVPGNPGGGGIALGGNGSVPKYLTNVSGQLFFQANDRVNGDELWRVPSGGSATMVEDNIPGGGIEPGNYSSIPNQLYNFGGTLYFKTLTASFSYSLWRVSGAGNASVVMNSGAGVVVDPTGSYPSELTSSGGTLYFQASNSGTGSELWRIGTDGTAQVVLAAGTTGGINPGIASSVPSLLTDVSGTLYFQAKSNANDYELWRVNSLGIAELVDDAAPGIGIAPGAAASSPYRLTNVSGTLYFAANDGSQGVELWRIPSSGIAEIVEDSVAGGGLAVGPSGSTPDKLTNVNGRLFFSATNAAQGTELWQIDNAGVARVIENAIPGNGINPGTASSNPDQLSTVNGTLFFAATDGSHGVELWKINNTSAVAAQQINTSGSVRGINRHSESSNPLNLTLLNGTLYFAASDGTNGTELWSLNSFGVAELVEDSVVGGGLSPATISSNPRDLTNVNGTVYFSANTATGTGLWRIQSSGLAELVFDSLPSGGINVGQDIPRSSLLTNVNGTLYFVAADAANGNELWRLNASGTPELVEDNVAGGGLNPGNASSNPKSLVSIGDTLFFVATNVLAGEEIWRVSNLGLAELADNASAGDGIYPGIVGSGSKELINFGGTLFFQANGGEGIGAELWRVGATGLAELVEPSTLILGGINPNFSSYPAQLTTSGGTLYFQANDGTRGVEMWRVTSSGIPSLVEVTAGGDLNPGIASSNPRYLTDVSGTLYFQANNIQTGFELWRVNSSGTIEIVEDAVAGGGIRPGSNSSAPTKLSNLNGTLYFKANDGISGFELWRVNGSGVAELVEDSIPGGGLAPGSNGSEYSNPDSLISVSGNVFFTAEDSSRGRELFTINSAGLAVAVGGENGSNEILPGPTAANPKSLTNVNGVLYFSADSGPRFGIELMRLSTNAPPTLVRNNATVTGGINTQLVNSGTWSDVEGDAVVLTASIGNIVKNQDGTWNWTLTPTSALANQVVQITATDVHGDATSVPFLASTASTAAQVLNRQIFYNRASSPTFGNGSGNPTASIDSSKSALLPGQAASFSNYTNYRLGLNGIIVDVAGLGASVTIADFQFATWNGFASAGFVQSSAVPVLTVIPGGGSAGSTRLKIEFADNAIRNTWLRVTLLGNANTGLSANDTFYFGNAIGEMNIGNVANPALLRVDESDVQRVRQNQSNSVSVTNIFDLNKDGRVNSIDFSLVRQNRTSSALRLFTAPLNLRLAPTSGSIVMTTLSVPKIESALSAINFSPLPVNHTQATDQFFASFS